MPGHLGPYTDWKCHVPDWRPRLLRCRNRHVRCGDRRDYVRRPRLGHRQRRVHGRILQGCRAYGHSDIRSDHRDSVPHQGPDAPTDSLPDHCDLDAHDRSHSTALEISHDGPFACTDNCDPDFCSNGNSHLLHVEHAESELGLGRQCLALA